MRIAILSASLLATTLLADALIAEDSAARTTPSTITDISFTSQPPVRTEQAGAQHLAQAFIESLNATRIALALKDDARAKAHMEQAETVLQALTAPSLNRQPPSPIGSGRLSYTANQHYYLPVEVEAGPVSMKRMTSSSLWHKDGIAVTDAEIVYLTLDLRDQKAVEALTDAKQALHAHEYSTAERQISDLMEHAIQIETAVSIPIEKARDNIALTRAFIQARNYDGARYALEHADEALGSLVKDPRYAARKGAVTDMRAEVVQLKSIIDRRDPSLLTKADHTLDQWWLHMKEWAQK